MPFMSTFRLQHVAVLALVTQGVLGAGINMRNAHVRRGTAPKYPYDPNTTPYCSWWYENGGAITCEAMPSAWFITMEEFVRWNPSLEAGCDAFEVGKSYCVEAYGEPAPGSTTSTTSTTSTALTSSTTSETSSIPTASATLVTSTTSTRPPTTTSAPSMSTSTTTNEAVMTPTPTQPGMVGNCDAFHFVELGQGCQTIADTYGITLAEFVTWNPDVGTSCSGLWAEVYVCVSVIGHDGSSSSFPPDTTTLISSTTTAPSTTSSSSSGNGISTPTPTQPGMVSNCDLFHFVEQGQGCQAIADLYGISLSDFTTWNPNVGGSSCTGLWAEVWVCVSVIGHTATSSPSSTTTTTTTTRTASSSGIPTPSPTQPGMVSNCDDFHKVASGDNCQKIADGSGITLDQFLVWNPEVGGTACSGLWFDAWVCISIIGHEPTPTDPVEPVETPSPIQDGMTGDCDTFHFVQSGQGCQTIADMYGISLLQFVAWNPAAKYDCSGLWANTYACVGIL